MKIIAVTFSGKRHVVIRPAQPVMWGEQRR